MSSFIKSRGIKNSPISLISFEPRRNPTGDLLSRGSEFMGMMTYKVRSFPFFFVAPSFNEHVLGKPDRSFSIHDVVVIHVSTTYPKAGDKGLLFPGDVFRKVPKVSFDSV